MRAPRGADYSWARSDELSQRHISSFLVAGATLVSQSTSSGAGQVTITFDPTTDSCSPAAPTTVIAPRAAFTG